MKIENKATLKVNLDKLIKHINSLLETVPTTHQRGISKMFLVDRIEDPRLDPAERAELPGLYHPKMPGSPAFIEVALETLRSESTWYKRLSRRVTFKANVTTTVLSLIGQHYYLTYSHGIKKSQYESFVRTYTEKQLSNYARSKKGIRASLFKPFRPLIEKLARWLRKRYMQQLRAKDPSRQPAKKQTARRKPGRRRKR